MPVRPVRDDLGYVTEPTRSLPWRKSLHSPEGAGAACLQAVGLRLRKQEDGSYRAIRLGRGSLRTVSSPNIEDVQVPARFDQRLRARASADRATRADPVRLPMDLSTLTELAQKVRDFVRPEAREADSGGELSASDCVLLVASLSKALYPGDARLASLLAGDLHGGVAPRRAVDDSVVGTGRDGGQLARGARWKRADSWGAVAKDVGDAGEGASAFVLWQRRRGTGHAFAAHSTTQGVHWLEIGADNEHQVLAAAPVNDVAHARYVVIDAAGRIVDKGSPAALESHSTARAIIDAPLRNDYGDRGPYIGIELELNVWTAALKSGKAGTAAGDGETPVTPPLNPLPKGTLGINREAFILQHGNRMWGNSSVTLTAEHVGGKNDPSGFEIVGNKVIPESVEERELWRSVEYVVDALEDSKTLAELFEHSGDFRPLDYPDVLLISPELGRERFVYMQCTCDMRPSEMLDWLLTDVTSTSDYLSTAQADIEAGAALGKLIAARYLASRYGMEVRFPHLAWELLDDPDYRSVGGLITLVFTQAVTAVHAAIDKESGESHPWFKSYTAAASRHDPALLSRALSSAAREFLDHNSNAIMSEFSSHASLTIKDYGRDPMDAPFQEDNLNFPARDYVDNFLKRQPGRIVSQQTLGVLTTFDEVDKDKVLVELRHLRPVTGVAAAHDLYDKVAKPIVARDARAEERQSSGDEHHARQRRLIAAIGNNPTVGALERVLSLTSRFNALNFARGRGHVLLDRASVQVLVDAVVGSAAPQYLTNPRNQQDLTNRRYQQHGEAGRALARLDEQLVALGVALNLSGEKSGDPIWERIKRDWAQVMQDISGLRQLLTGEVTWPPEDFMEGWKQKSVKSGSMRGLALRQVDTAVAEALSQSDDEASLRKVLVKVRDLRKRPILKSDSSADRAPALRQLERFVVHKLSTIVEHATYPMPNPKAVDKWRETFEYASDFLREQLDEARGKLLSKASKIAAEYHVDPPQKSEFLSASESSYLATYSDVVNLVASLLGRDQNRSNPEERARQVAQETARDFGSARPASANAWSRHEDLLPLRPDTSTDGPSIEGPRHEVHILATSHEQALPAVEGSAPTLPLPERDLRALEEQPTPSNEVQEALEAAQRIYLRSADESREQAAGLAVEAGSTGSAIESLPEDAGMLSAYLGRPVDSVAPRARTAEELQVLLDRLVRGVATTTGAVEELSPLGSVTVFAGFLRDLHPDLAARFGQASPRSRRYGISPERALFPGPGWHDVSDESDSRALVEFAELHGPGTTVILVHDNRVLGLHNSSDGVLVVDPLASDAAQRVRSAAGGASLLALPDPVGGRFIVIGSDDNILFTPGFRPTAAAVEDTAPRLPELPGLDALKQPSFSEEVQQALGGAYRRGPSSPVDGREESAGLPNEAGGGNSTTTQTTREPQTTQTAQSSPPRGYRRRPPAPVGPRPMPTSTTHPQPATTAAPETAGHGGARSAADPVGPRSQGESREQPEGLTIEIDGGSVIEPVPADAATLPTETAGLAGDGAYPQAAFFPPGNTARTTGPHEVKDLKTGITWASSTKSALDADGNPMPEGERRCVEAAVVSPRMADSRASSPNASPFGSGAL